MKILSKVRSKMVALQLMLLAMVFSGAAMATEPTSPVDQIVAKIEAAGADGVLLATSVVLALWGIWAIYLLRRRG